MNPSAQILCGDAIEMLRTLPDKSVHTCVTSPPYWALRDYGVVGQIGLEPTVPEFLARMVAVFREVHRVLRDDGTCWVNLGDTYNGSGLSGGRAIAENNGQMVHRGAIGKGTVKATGLKPKDLVGIPWRVAFALQDDGWYLRQDIIWHKPNPMPESIRDRCTKAHEYIFLLSKRPKYYFDFAAMQEPVSGTAHARGSGINTKIRTPGANSRIHIDRDPSHQTEAKIRAKQNRSFSAAVTGLVSTRNKRSVWSVGSSPYKGAHFATFPPALIRPCVLAGAPVGGVVLDPFAGSGTTGAVAIEHGRNAVLIELNPNYVPLIEERLSKSRKAV